MEDTTYKGKREEEEEGIVKKSSTLPGGPKAESANTWGNTLVTRWFGLWLGASWKRTVGVS